MQVAGKPHPGGQYQSMGAGEEVPPMLDAIGQPVSLTLLVAGVKLSEWNDGEGLAYWTRFENLLGERFQVRSYPDQTRPTELSRLADRA